MRKGTLVVIIGSLILSLTLSSCAINIFKSFDTPNSLSNVSKSALEAANSGDAKTAIELSSQVITTVASSSSQINSQNLYEALTTVPTSLQAEKVINDTTANVKEIKVKLQNGEISPTSTEGIAVKNAAISMVRSISKIKKMEISDVISQLIDALDYSKSSMANVKGANILSTTFDATQASRMVVLLLSVAKDMPTLNLMSELSGLLSIYGGDEAFNWDLSTVIYDTLYCSTAFFDSNEDGTLTTSDEIFEYVWDSQKNKFKNLDEINVEKVMNISLATYNNQSLSEKVIEKVGEVIANGYDALNHTPESLKEYMDSINLFLNVVKNFYNALDASKLSSFKTVGDLVSFFANNFKGM